MIAIVLGVVGLIWWPVFANARDGRSPDFYRLRSMSRAQEVYLQDHDMRLQRGDLWMDALYPYVKTTTTFVDSQTGLGEHEGPAFNDRKSGEYGYSFFQPLGLKALSEIEFPDRQIMVFQSSDLRWNASGPLDSMAFRRGGVAARALTAFGSSRIVEDGTFSKSAGVIDAVPKPFRKEKE